MRWPESFTSSATTPPGRCVQDDQSLLLAGVYIAAASEAIAFAAKQGLDIRKVYEVITASAGNSWMFENRMPHVLDGDYSPRSAEEIFVKDLGIIQDMARSAKFLVPVCRRRTADVLNDGRTRRGLRRRRLCGTDVCQGRTAQPLARAGRASAPIDNGRDNRFCSSMGQSPFYSQTDEDHFFCGLWSISAIKN